jgi:hypothetical protein
MQFNLFEGISTVDPALWDQATRGHPFAGWQWCHFGEVAHGHPGFYLMATEGGEPVGGAIFWVIPDEMIPTQHEIVRRLLGRYLRWRPLIACRTALDTTHLGIFMPSDPESRAIFMAEVRRVAVDLLHQQHGSFFVADYLSSAEMDYPWGDFFVLKDFHFQNAGTYLTITWESFEAYKADLKAQGKKAYRNIKDNTRHAVEAGITVSLQRDAPPLDELLHLQAIHAKHYDQPFNPARTTRTVNATVSLPENNCRWVLAYCKGELVAYKLVLFDDANRIAYATLYASDHATEFAYFLMSYEDIRYAMEGWQAQVIFYGSEGYEFKRRMGFELDTRDQLVFYPAGRIERSVAGWLLRWMDR